MPPKNQIQESYQLALSLLKNDNFSDQDTYFNEIQSLANQGYVPAQARLAEAYYYALGVDLAPKQAFKWAKVAANQSEAGAQYLLAVLYRDQASIISPELTQQDADKKAVHWLNEAIKNGNAKAKVALISMKKDGRGIAQVDLHQIIAEYTALKEDDNEGMAYYELGLILHNEKKARHKVIPNKDEAAAKFFSIARERGHLKAEQQLGFMLLEGIGVKGEFKGQAAAAFRKAAYGNLPYSQMQYARICEGIDGSKPDLKQALYWYCKAAENGQEYALDTLKLEHVAFYHAALHVKNNQYPELLELCKRYTTEVPPDSDAFQPMIYRYLAYALMETAGKVANQSKEQFAGYQQAYDAFTIYLKSYPEDHSVIRTNKKIHNYLQNFKFKEDAKISASSTTSADIFSSEAFKTELAAKLAIRKR